MKDLIPISRVSCPSPMRGRRQEPIKIPDIYSWLVSAPDTTKPRVTAAYFPSASTTKTKSDSLRKSLPRHTPVEPVVYSSTCFPYDPSTTYPHHPNSSTQPLSTNGGEGHVGLNIHPHGEESEDDLLLCDESKGRTFMSYIQEKTIAAQRHSQEQYQKKQDKEVVGSSESLANETKSSSTTATKDGHPLSRAGREISSQETAAAYQEVLRLSKFVSSLGSASSTHVYTGKTFANGDTETFPCSPKEQTFNARIWVPGYRALRLQAERLQVGGGAVSIFISTTHPHISMGEMRADSGYYHASLYFNKRYGSVITRDSATSERYAGYYYLTVYANSPVSIRASCVLLPALAAAYARDTATSSPTSSSSSSSLSSSSSSTNDTPTTSSSSSSTSSTLSTGGSLLTLARTDSGGVTDGTSHNTGTSGGSLTHITNTHSLGDGFAPRPSKTHTISISTSNNNYSTMGPARSPLSSPSAGRSSSSSSSLSSGTHSRRSSSTLGVQSGNGSLANMPLEVVTNMKNIKSDGQENGYMSKGKHGHIRMGSLPSTSSISSTSHRSRSKRSTNLSTSKGPNLDKTEAYLLSNAPSLMMTRRILEQSPELVERILMVDRVQKAQVKALALGTVTNTYDTSATNTTRNKR